MALKPFYTLDGTHFELEIPKPSNHDSFFIFGMHKSGSTLMNNIFIDVCKLCNLSYVDYEGEIFKRGYSIDDLAMPMDTLFEYNGYAYIGFRTSRLVRECFDLSRTKNVLLIRDPRDSITSHYYSLRNSHPIPKSGPQTERMKMVRSALKSTSIDDFVLRGHQIKQVKKVFNEYLELLPRNTSRIYRYEDVIFYKEEWIRDMLTFLEIELDGDKTKSIARKHDLVPDKERPDKHIRQVVPGNYKKHLKKETITKLNEAFREILIAFGYNRIPYVKMNNHYVL